MKVPKLNDTPDRTNRLTIEDFLNWILSKMLGKAILY